MFNLIQSVSEPTHNQGHLLDLVFSKQSDNILISTKLHHLTTQPSYDMHTFLVSKVWCSRCLWHSQHVIRLVYSGKVFSIRLTYQPNAVFKKQPDSPFVTASWDSIWSLPRRWQLKVRRLLSFCCFCVWKCISFRYSPFVCLVVCCCCCCFP